MKLYFYIEQEADELEIDAYLVGPFTEKIDAEIYMKNNSDKDYDGMMIEIDDAVGRRYASTFKIGQVSE